MIIVHTAQLPEGELVIRYPVLSDAPVMCEYINTLSREQTFIRFQGEEISIEQETAFLNGLLRKINQQQAIMLLAFLNEKLVAISGIELKDKTEGHEGVFGISLAAEARGKGWGSLIMKLILDLATAELPDLKLITLDVFENNEAAIKLYQKLGFAEYGKLPGGIKYKGEYIDKILMFYPVVR